MQEINYIGTKSQLAIYEIWIEGSIVLEALADRSRKLF